MNNSVIEVFEDFEVEGKFRYCAKSVLLTYSQCPISKDDCLKAFQDVIFKKNPIEEYAIA